MTPKEQEFETVVEEKWVRVNDKAPIWMREPKEVSDEEYKEFYKAVAKDANAETLGWSHFKVGPKWYTITERTRRETQDLESLIKL